MMLLLPLLPSRAWMRTTASADAPEACTAVSAPAAVVPLTGPAAAALQSRAAQVPASDDATEPGTVAPPAKGLPAALPLPLPAPGQQEVGRSANDARDARLAMLHWRSAASALMDEAAMGRTWVPAVAPRHREAELQPDA